MYPWKLTVAVILQYKTLTDTKDFLEVFSFHNNAVALA